jgi:hypothetical protein
MAWPAVVDLRANSKLKSAEYSVPVLGLIFLRYADQKFAEAATASRLLEAPEPIAHNTELAIRRGFGRLISPKGRRHNDNRGKPTTVIGLGCMRMSAVF